MPKNPPKERPASAQAMEYQDEKEGSPIPEGFEPDAGDKLQREEAAFDPDVEEPEGGKERDSAFDEKDDELPEYADPRDGEDFEGGSDGKEGKEEKDDDDNPWSDPNYVSESDYAEYGLTLEQARDLDQKGQLAETLNAYDQQVAQAGRAPQYAPPQQMVPPMVQPMQPQPMSPPVPQGGVPGQQQPGAFQLELSPKEYDPKVVEQLNAMNAFYAQKMARMETIMVHRAMQDQQDRQMAAINDFESWVGDLPEAYHDEFGKGPIEMLMPHGPQYRKRQELFDTIASLRNGYATTGRPAPPDQVLRTRALRMVSNSSEKRVRQEVKGAAEKLRRGISRRPTHRRGADTRTPEQRAVALAEKKLKEAGR